MKKIQSNNLHKDLQIASGKYRGQRFFRADAEITRPIKAASRQAIFNILYSKYPAGFDVLLDCFAGSGAFSIEAISRNFVNTAIAVDVSMAAIKSINENIKLLHTKVKPA